MEKTFIQQIKAIASKLHHSKLQRLGGKEMGWLLEGLKANLGLDTKEEAILFTAAVVEGLAILMILPPTLIAPNWTSWNICRPPNHYQRKDL